MLSTASRKPKLHLRQRKIKLLPLHRETSRLRSSRSPARMAPLQVLPLFNPSHHRREWPINGNRHTKQGHLTSRLHINPSQALPTPRPSLTDRHTHSSSPLRHEEHSLAPQEHHLTCPHPL